MDIPEEADGCSDNDLLCYSILSAVSERKAQWAMHICKERVWKVLFMLLRTGVQPGSLQLCLGPSLTRNMRTSLKLLPRKVVVCALLLSIELETWAPRGQATHNTSAVGLSATQKFCARVSLRGRGAGI
jgi:hypothetical protein